MAMNTLSWRTCGKHQEGILVAANKTQEWLLEWWWENYSRFNRYPVTFVDLGLTDKAKRWCQERGELIPFPPFRLNLVKKRQIDPVLLKEWEFFYGRIDWKRRFAFFQKPLVCLQTPYQKTLWLDLDCEVRCDLNEIFAYFEDS